MKDRVNDMLKQADMMAKQIALTKRMYEIQRQITAITHESIGMTKEYDSGMLNCVITLRISTIS